MASLSRMRGAPASLSGRARSSGRSVRQGSHVAEIQRARLLAGAVRAVDEFGYTRTTVGEITGQAHVSRRTFYELFANSEDCLAAMFDEAVERIAAHIADSRWEELSWLERVRAGLWGILLFLDREPALARVCVVQSARGGSQILERRERVLKRLADLVHEGRDENNAKTECSELTAEGLVGAALSIVHTRLAREDSAPLSDLHGELMAMIVLPYLGPGAARKERKRTTPVRGANNAPKLDPDGIDERERDRMRRDDPLRGLPIRLTYRTVCVLEAVAEEPGLSNRAVGSAAGISDQGQISKLLARLERYRLLENRGEGGHAKGEPNAWHLTFAGHQVAQVVGSARERDYVSSPSEGTIQ